MDTQQLKKALDKLDAEITKRYDMIPDGQKVPGYLQQVNQARGEIEVAICKCADILDLDDIFTN